MQGIQQIFRLQVPSPRSQCFHCMKSDTRVQPPVTKRTFPAFLCQPAGHGPVCSDENHAVIITWAKARDFQTFRNEAGKLLSGIQSCVKQRSPQPQQSQQPTLSRSSSATSAFVPQTFQQSQQIAPAAREYIPETQMPASQVIQPAQQIQRTASMQRAAHFLHSC